ncbi:putative solute-binding protein [Thalassolituus sp. LLYu03]|uniref:putative solute-binding protein n=1 Tax=Thalassolituus sp. LLYu03 TaxID=3421656 RepID=UPI003D2C0D0A
MTRITKQIALLLAVLMPLTVWSQTDDDRRNERLMATIMSQNLPLEKRITALKKLYSDQVVDGKIHRSFCVWDMLGKSGPIFATVDDQKLRSLHYGLELDVVAYQKEEELVDDLRSGKCDAALMSGSRALDFNRFAGTLEALGAVPDVTHLQMLMQVVANPKMADKLEGNGYVVLGVASLGENYAYTNNPQLRQLTGFSGINTAVPSSDPSLKALADNLRAVRQDGEQLAVVQSFASGGADTMLAPIVAFYAAGAGQAGADAGILNYPLSQSTIQLIGRQDRFPTGLAQILREDFLFKFDFYVKRVEKERANLKPGLWRDIERAEQTRIEQRMQGLRVALRDKGVYDANMLKLERKVRCKVAPERSECTNPVE